MSGNRSTIRHYPAVIEEDDASGYGVIFPDFPGCVAAGETLEEAVANAGESLSLHMRGMVENGEQIPEPSELNAPLPDWLKGSVGAVHVLVKVATPGKSIPVLRYSIIVEWDDEACVWYGYSTDIEGLIIEAPTLGELFRKAADLVPELLWLNGQPCLFGETDK